MKEREFKEMIREYISSLPDEYVVAKGLVLAQFKENDKALCFCKKLFRLVEAARVPLLEMKGGAA